MKSGFPIFLAAFVALGLSWYGLVLKPTLQLGGAKLATVLNSSDEYPLQRPGDAAMGLQVYRANGCAACHTTQVRQTGSTFEIVLANAGKNPVAVSNLLASLNLTGLTKEEADAANDKISAAGGKTEMRMFATGPDVARGWGLRRSVAADFLYDKPVQLGSLRVGPDLANIGVRLPDANWQLLHLYAPSSVVKNSAMPPFGFLFEKRKIINGHSSPDALNVSGNFAPPSDFEIVPTEDAKNLAAYLLSLRADAPLYEAPFTPPPSSTNAPAKK